MRQSHLKASLSVLAGSSLIIFLALAPMSCSRASDKSASTAQQPSAANELALRQGMRKLWEDHITWTRLVIVSTAANLPDLGQTTDRLLQNQTDIGDAIKQYYGDDAGNKLTELLRAHITGAADVLAAAKAKNNAKLDGAKKAWYSNADEIATFLSTANPTSWPLEDMKSMMHDHLDLTLQEAANQLKGDYAGSIQDYDKVHTQILKMADMLSDGIIRQFPAKV